MRAVLDRFEGDWAVLLLEGEPGERAIPVTALPPGAREGDWLLVREEGGELVALGRDDEARAAAEARIAAKLARLRRGDHLAPPPDGESEKS
ncbi:MAG TPA: DUF3006 domain-containing protein [Herpetosiphonaceae bacterium]